MDAQLRFEPVAISPQPLITPSPASDEQQTPLPSQSASQSPAASAETTQQQETPLPSASALVSPSPLPAEELTSGSAVPSAFLYGALAGAALVSAVAIFISARVKQHARKKKSARSVSYLPEGFEVGNARHIGCRGNQEDAFAISDLHNERLVSESGMLALVSDGMGGLADGELVSGAAVSTAIREFPILPDSWTPPQRLLYLVERANDAANEVTGGVSNHGGATFVAALMRQGWLWFASVGDSKICLVRGGALITLNRPHTYESDLDKRAAGGEISFEAALADGQRSALTSYVGMGSLDAVDYSPRGIQLLAGDWVLLMTDGVFNTLGDEEIAALLQGSAQSATERIQQRVLAKGHPQQDNLTVIALRIR